MQIQRNKELTKLIGRRLREAYGSSVDRDLPAVIADRLAALRQAEEQPADGSDDTTAEEDAAFDRLATPDIESCDRSFGARAHAIPAK